MIPSNMPILSSSHYKNAKETSGDKLKQIQINNVALERTLSSRPICWHLSADNLQLIGSAILFLNKLHHSIFSNPIPQLIEYNFYNDEAMSYDDTVRFISENTQPNFLEQMTEQEHNILKYITSNTNIFNTQLDIKTLISEMFYKNIYSQASSNIEYALSEKDLDEWNTLVISLQKSHHMCIDYVELVQKKKVSLCAKPDNEFYGIATGFHYLERDFNKIQAVYLYKYEIRQFAGLVPHSYSYRGRLQFIVNTGAGAKLYREIQAIMTTFITKEYEKYVHNSNSTFNLTMLEWLNSGLFPIIEFKVLSAKEQQNRPESAVFYLSEEPSNPIVKEFVYNYLNPIIKDNTVKCDILGMKAINETNIYGGVLPFHNLETYKNLCKCNPTNSWGGIMTDILTYGYTCALEELSNSKLVLDVDQLNKTAMEHAKTSFNLLGMNW